mmetsp:Transcript_47995/g.71519  ORF Transcript_47995/g.71519 Transcript_47995/m.71519 type:complete len:118 (-) Transcript_47995:3519-3872(-)
MHQTRQRFQLHGVSIPHELQRYQTSATCLLFLFGLRAGESTTVIFDFMDLLGDFLDDLRGTKTRLLEPDCMTARDAEAGFSLSPTLNGDPALSETKSDGILVYFLFMMDDNLCIVID